MKQNIDNRILRGVGLAVLGGALIVSCSTRDHSNPIDPVQPQPTPTVTLTPQPVTAWHQATGVAAFSSRYGHASVVFDGKIWVIGGLHKGSPDTLLDDVWYSDNGVDWYEATSSGGFGGRSGHTSVIFNNKIWVLGGDDNTPYYSDDVWSSPDGITWTQTAVSAFGERTGHTSVVYDNKMWVIAGTDDSVGPYFYDVHYSMDGVTWFTATGVAAFGNLAYHKSVVYDNKMWVIGGWSTQHGYRPDCWYSTDGINWVEAQGEFDFIAGPVGHACVVYENWMWSIGGSTYTSYIGDKVFFGSGTTNWNVLVGVTGFPGRAGHTSVVFNDKIWVIGGSAGVGEGTLNDVWYLE